VTSAAHFDRWWRDVRRTDPERLTYTRELLIGATGVAALAGRPVGWKQAGQTLPLSYTFAPGAEDDGVTVHVPLTQLNALSAADFEWLVPALRAELVTALLRTLPKELRRPLVPLPDVAAEVLARLRPRREPLLPALARELQAVRGVPVPPSAFDLARLPPHLRMRFRVEDAEGAALAEGDDLEALRAQVRPRLRAQLAAATSALERTGLVAWTLGTLPRTVTLPGAGDAVRAYPALVDEGETVGVRALDSAEAQRAAMVAGTRRLLTLALPSPARAITGRLGNVQRLALATAPHGSVAAVLDDVVGAAIDALVAEAGGPAWDAEGFARLRAHVGAGLEARAAAVLDDLVAILDARGAVHRRLETLIAPPLVAARQDVARQLGGLVFRGMATADGAARLPDVLRYVRAAERRLERLPDAVAVDRDRMAALHALEEDYAQARAATPDATALAEVPWLIEELRVSQFAQGLGVKGPVSAKRIRALLGERAPTGRGSPPAAAPGARPAAG
jgi:ATP-dependent helicase HrpA